MIRCAKNVNSQVLRLLISMKVKLPTKALIKDLCLRLVNVDTIV